MLSSAASRASGSEIVTAQMRRTADRLQALGLGRHVPGQWRRYAASFVINDAGRAAAQPSDGGAK